MGDLVTLLFMPFLVFLIFPYGAGIVALVFFIVYWRTGQWLSLFVATLWLLYAVYETLMYLRITCTGECNIRVDLLLIIPVLALLTVLAIGRALWSLRRRRA